MDDAEGAARDALAMRLSALREGSGRTYASLARRIGVSGSTLHRYCTGATVPAEFAPVERLARFCGAPAQEREALHRLWMRADAERVDRQAAAATTTATGVPGGEAGTPREAAEAVPSYVGGAGTPPRSGPGGEPVAGPHRVRRVRGLGQALAALAVTILVLVLVAALGGTRPSGPGREPSVAQGPGEAPTAGLGPSASGRATPGAPDRAGPGGPGEAVSGSPRPTASPGLGPRQETLPRPGGTTPGPRTGPAPFTWTGDDQVWKNGCDHSYLVDRAPAAVPPPPAEADAAAWAEALGAVHAGETGVRITLQGRDERAVVLEALRIRVVERRAPANGRVYRMSSGCGGALTPRMFDVDLDVPRPVARSVPGNDSGEPVEAVAFPYRVSASDPEVLLVTGRTVRCDCDWFAELAWSSGGRSGTVRIDDGGRPFRTSGVRGRSVHDYDTGAGRWAPAEGVGERADPAAALEVRPS